MADTLPFINTQAISLDAAIDELRRQGFRPDCPENVKITSTILAGLYANRCLFLDSITYELCNRMQNPAKMHRYTGQTLELGGDGQCGFILRANIWPSVDDPLMNRRGAEEFQYGFAHDHNFDFLTIGYHGPGYRSEFFAYDYGSIVGYLGETISLTPTKTVVLGEGQMLHYRAHQDVHRQWPPDQLSISLNIVHVHPRQGWLDQYGFDIESGQISRILSHSPLEALLTFSPFLAGDVARAIVEEIMHNHPSPAIRLSAAKAICEWSIQEGGQALEFWKNHADHPHCGKIRNHARAQLAEANTQSL